MDDSACPKCGAEDSLDFDLVQGITACAACGAVLDEDPLVHAVFDEQGAVGTIVRADDTGECSSAGRLLLRQQQQQQHVYCVSVPTVLPQGEPLSLT